MESLSRQWLRKQKRLPKKHQPSNGTCVETRLDGFDWRLGLLILGFNALVFVNLRVVNLKEPCE